jgi:hypothetical protein
MSSTQLLTFAAVLVGLFFVIPVVLLRLSQRAPGVPHLVPISADRVSQPLGTLLKRVVDPLLGAGFTLQGYVEGPAPPGAKVGVRYIVFFAAPDRSTWAMARGIQRSVTSGDAGFEADVEFTTLFTGDAEVDTNSSSILGFFVRPARKAVYAFPSERNPLTLYALHRRLVERHRRQWGAPDAPPSTLEEGLERIRRLWPREFEQQVAAGVFSRAGDGTYRLTWKGAIRGVALLGTPGKHIRDALRRSRAATLAAELRALPERSAL